MACVSIMSSLYSFLINTLILLPYFSQPLILYYLYLLYVLILTPYLRSNLLWWDVLASALQCRSSTYLLNKPTLQTPLQSPHVCRGSHLNLLAHLATYIPCHFIYIDLMNTSFISGSYSYIYNPPSDLHTWYLHKVSHVCCIIDGVLSVLAHTHPN